MRGMRMRHMHHHSGEDQRGRGGHGRRRARRGSIRLSILRLLNERPMHGYELIQEFEQRTGGRWRPSPGSVYPTLAQLEDEGLVTASDVDGRKRFELTDAGRTWLDEHQDEEQALPWEHPGGGRTGELRRLSAEIVGQVRQLLRFGTPAQLDRTRDILSRTRSELYEVLAAPPAGAPTDATTETKPEG